MNKYIVYHVREYEASGSKQGTLGFCEDTRYPQISRSYYRSFVVGVFRAENLEEAKEIFKSYNWLEGVTPERD